MIKNLGRYSQKLLKVFIFVLKISEKADELLERYIRMQISVCHNIKCSYILLKMEFLNNSPKVRSKK